MKKYAMILFMAVVPVLAIAQAATDIPLPDFLSQVFAAVKSFGGLTWGLKVGLILNLVISSSKVSFIRPYSWDKIPGALKPWFAPLLAMLAGAFAFGKHDYASLAAWAMAGGGAVLLDNVLEGVKQIPGLGPVYVSAIDFISKLLRKPSEQK